VQKNSDETLEKERLDLELDKELKDTFPASDALKITRGRPEQPTRSRRLEVSGH
jgi:hypothetical protein